MMFGIYADCRMTTSKTLVWISGNTFAVKDSLKTDGFKWSSKKRAWWMPKTEYQARIERLTDGNDVKPVGAWENEEF